MPISYLVDTSFLYALFDKDSPQHMSVRDIVVDPARRFMFPEITLVETSFLFRRDSGVNAVAAFLKSLIAMRPRLLSVEPVDLLRASAIMIQYRDSKLDFVDCCLMALSERLNVRHVCTFDRRDFSIFRPQHCDYLELIP